jgi:hypothetical protein
MVTAIEAARERDETNEEIITADEPIRTESAGLAPLLVQYVKGVATFLEGRLKDMLTVAGRAKEDKYREWSILEEIERLWTRLLDQKVEQITARGAMSLGSGSNCPRTSVTTHIMMSLGS